MSPVAAVIILFLFCLAVGGILTVAVKRELKAREAKEVEGESESKGPRKHAHQWRYHSSAFNAPIGNAPKGQGAGIFELHLKLLYGFTNVTYTCAVDECTEVRVEEHVGRVSDPYQGKEYKPDVHD